MMILSKKAITVHKKHKKHNAPDKETCQKNPPQFISIPKIKRASQNQCQKSYLKFYLSWWSLFYRYSNIECRDILAFYHCTVGQGGFLKREFFTKRKRTGNWIGTRRKQLQFYKIVDNRIINLLGWNKRNRRQFQKRIHWLKKEGFLIEAKLLSGEKVLKFVMPEPSGRQSYVHIPIHSVKNGLIKISIQHQLNANKHPKIKGQYDLFKSSRTKRRHNFSLSERTKKTPYNPLIFNQLLNTPKRKVKLKMFDDRIKEIEWWKAKKIRRDCTDYLLTQHGKFKYKNFEWEQVQSGQKRRVMLGQKCNTIQKTQQFTKHKTARSIIKDHSEQTQEKLNEDAQEKVRQTRLWINEHKRKPCTISLDEMKRIRKEKFQGKKQICKRV